MKIRPFVVLLVLLMTQACSQQAETNKERSPEAALPQGPSEAELSRMVKSMELYFRSKQAMEVEKNPAKSFQMLDEAVAAAKTEKNPTAAILCRETQAKLKLTQSDTNSAINILKSTISEFPAQSLPLNAQVRLDGVKAFLASLYAQSGDSTNAEKIYKSELADSRRQKPINHQRVAFWLRNYSSFYRFQKNDKKSKELENESIAELKKETPTKKSR